MVNTHSGTHGDWSGGRGRWVVWLAGLVVVLTAGAATAHGLYVVALGSGTSRGIAWLYPVITDGLALVAYTATTRLTGPGRRYGWTVVVLAAGLSGLAQATYLAGALPPAAPPAGAAAAVATAPPALRFGVGAWPAMAAAIAAHLLFLIGTHRPRSPVGAHLSTTPGPVPADRDPREPWDVPGCPILGVPPVPSHAHQAVPARSGTERFALSAGLDVGRTPGMRRALSQADRARAIAELHTARTGVLPTVRELAEMADVGRGTADRALTALRASANGLHMVTDTPTEGDEQ